jgi:ribosomal protein L31
MFAYRQSASLTRRLFSTACARMAPRNDPEMFTQTVILSNGASFTRRTTSPRPLLRLTKDTRNHPFWNPTTQIELDDDSGVLTKFNKRFGELEDFNDLDFFDTVSDGAATGGKQK